MHTIEDRLEISIDATTKEIARCKQKKEETSDPSEKNFYDREISHWERSLFALEYIKTGNLQSQ